MKAVITGFKLTDIHKKMKKEAKKEWIHFPRIKYESYFMTRDLLLINYKLSMTKESSIGNFITWWNVLGFSCLDLFDEFHFRW